MFGGQKFAVYLRNKSKKVYICRIYVIRKIINH